MIREVWQNLGIAHFEYRTARTPTWTDVHDVGFTTETVSVPAEVQGLAIAIRTALRHQEKVLVDMHLLRENVASKRELLDLGPSSTGRSPSPRPGETRPPDSRRPSPTTPRR